MQKISKIAVLTSGGDAPGMNPCIRAVVRTAIYNGLQVAGIRQGYQGLIDNNMYDMNTRSVSNILNLGGTILKTARCLPFRTDEGMEQLTRTLKPTALMALWLLAVMVLLPVRYVFRKIPGYSCNWRTRHY
jgi:6-phosphofructokinase 1